MQYTRPDLDEVEQRFAGLLEQFKAAKTAEASNAVLGDITNLRADVDTMATLANIRHDIDTRDRSYKEENDYFDENQPRIQALVNDLYLAVTTSPFRKDLEQQWGPQFFRLADLSVKTFHPTILPELQQENKLSSQYSELMASAKIEFEGEERNLAQLGPFLTSPDREMRKRANAAKYEFMEAHGAEFDDIYDGLVKTRQAIALKLGYANFVEIAYARMGRSDYNAAMVANFRKQVAEQIVPLCTKLRERQRTRLGLDKLRFYDESFQFQSGNPKPQGNPEWIVDNGRQMYKELSAETDEFFTLMYEGGLMDLVAKPGKSVGGYCTGITNYHVPFIFSNFNGTLGDITVLTHEAGHAFQGYSSRNQPLLEYGFPTMESAEIHSMSMEFFTWPWMELFFKEDTEKFRFLHLQSALMFIPYGVAVDEFQHFVYEKPEATTEERRVAWRRIEKKYLPHRDYEGNDYLESGAFWHQQGHIFGAPFYYIDYTLAQICAFQYWVKMQQDKDAAWAEYLKICQVGGSQSFLEILQTGNLVSPFDDGCVASVVGEIESWLESVDDKAL